MLIFKEDIEIEEYPIFNSLLLSWHKILKNGPLRLKWTPNDRKFDAESISAVKCTRKTIFKEDIEIEEYPIYSLLLGGMLELKFLGHLHTLAI